MKHLLNNLTEEEKNSIRGQHTGGMNVVTENFSKLINTKSGDVRLFLNEESKKDKEKTSSDDLVTLLYSLRNSINDDNKKKTMGIIDDLLSIARDM